MQVTSNLLRSGLQSGHGNFEEEKQFSESQISKKRTGIVYMLVNKMQILSFSGKSDFVFLLAGIYLGVNQGYEGSSRVVM